MDQALAKVTGPCLGQEDLWLLPEAAGCADEDGDGDGDAGKGINTVHEGEADKEDLEPEEDGNGSEEDAQSAAQRRSRALRACACFLEDLLAPAGTRAAVLSQLERQRCDGEGAGATAAEVLEGALERIRAARRTAEECLGAKLTPPPQEPSPPTLPGVGGPSGAPPPAELGEPDVRRGGGVAMGAASGPDPEGAVPRGGSGGPQTPLLAISSVAPPGPPPMGGPGPVAGLPPVTGPAASGKEGGTPKRRVVGVPLLAGHSSPIAMKRPRRGEEGSVAVSIAASTCTHTAEGSSDSGESDGDDVRMAWELHAQLNGLRARRARQR